MAAEPEPLSLTPGPSVTPSRWAPMTTVSSGSPAMLSAMRLKGRAREELLLDDGGALDGGARGCGGDQRGDGLAAGQGKRGRGGVLGVARARCDVGELVLGCGSLGLGPGVVVDEDGAGAGGTGVVDLRLEGAHAALHEHDRAGGDRGEVGGFAAEAQAVGAGGRERERGGVFAVDTLAQVEVGTLVGRSPDGEGRLAELGVRELERVTGHGEGARRFEHALRVDGGGLVSRGAPSAVSLRGEGLADLGDRREVRHDIGTGEAEILRSLGRGVRRRRQHQRPADEGGRRHGGGEPTGARGRGGGGVSGHGEGTSPRASMPASSRGNDVPTGGDGHPPILIGSP